MYTVKMIKEFSFKNIHRVLIFGCGGIGEALYQNLKLLHPDLEIYIVTTNKNVEVKNSLIIDNYDEKNIQLISQNFDQVDAIINTVGSLNALTSKPEKSLRDFDLTAFSKTLEINTGTAGLIAKHFHRKFPKDKVCMFSSLSALVGSIEENKLGGWYSYRISKTALNMLMKNIALELSRQKPHLIVTSVHPGTTDTKLSHNYLQSVQHQVLTPKECALRLINFYEGLSPSDNEIFYHANGDKIPY